MPTLDLRPAHRRLLLELLARHAPAAEVWAYGSRVNGRSHDGSDLDLVVRNPAVPHERFAQLYALVDALEESDLPILVEVHDWARLPEDMRHEAERERVVLQEPRATAPGPAGDHVTTS
ncbi:MAG: nucleotidyltransferase domain-containing protein [Verrucomicrobia bacterium]|nr:nucleotidyltransferase domain-containing protein [Verrucomicrobiota bacterium]